MRSKVSSFSIILTFISLMIVGLAFIPKLPVKLNPSHALPQIQISFNMQGSSSRVVESAVTSKLEGMLSRVKGVQNISSTSGNGWGSILVKLDKHVNLDLARFDISTIIRQAWPQLPKGVSYPIISQQKSDDKASRPFMSYTVNAPASPIIIQQFVENKIKLKLAQIPGINRVTVRGAMPMEWQLVYDYKQLESLHVEVSDIRKAIINFLNKEQLGIAQTTVDHHNLMIRVALASGIEEGKGLNVGAIVVKNSSGRLIALKELVKINHVEKKANSYFRINGLNSIYLSVFANEDANQLSLSSQIKSTLQTLKNNFPPGYEIYLNYDATDYIHSELQKIYYRSILTLLILLVFVLLIYRSLKYLLLITVSLTVNVCISFIFYYLLHLEMQLYSLAGLTISLTLIIDNTIVMSDQIIRKHNKRAFLAILAATLTSIASLVIIFFMDEKVKLNLQDFACVIMVNLSVSLLVSLFFVPAMLEKLNITERKRKHFRRRRKYNFNRFYAAFCRQVWRWRSLAILLLILGFGLPIYLLPDKIEGDGIGQKYYNQTLGSNTYKATIKPILDKALGGSLRLFTEKVSNSSYSSDRGETILHASAMLPNGATVMQMNELIQRMETYLSQFPEIKQFQTSIYNAHQADIDIYFKKSALQTSFPVTLKSKLITHSLELGGGSWSIYGLGNGFSNDIRELAGNYRVIMYGYNYDELTDIAEKFRTQLLTSRRINEVLINSDFAFFKIDYQEFELKLNKEKLAEAHIEPIQLFSSIMSVCGPAQHIAQIVGSNGMEDVMMSSKQSQEYDRWSLLHLPRKLANKDYKINELAQIDKDQVLQKIVRENQQYRICLQYNYIGSNTQGEKVLKKNMDNFRATLPVGYSIDVDPEMDDWGQHNKKPYLLILLVFIIIYFTTSILFNSFKQPFYVIFIIPISFVGVFLTFYFFDLNFDQGGFASFILLSGIVVNANIYILNEYNNIRKSRNLSSLQGYLRAWNSKIIPICLTIISTMLGFIPFIIGEKESFWFPLAAGTIGGLVMSLIGMFCFLPLFMGIGKRPKITSS